MGLRERPLHCRAPGLRGSDHLGLSSLHKAWEDLDCRAIGVQGSELSLSSWQKAWQDLDSRAAGLQGYEVNLVSWHRVGGRPERSEDPTMWEPVNDEARREIMHGLSAAAPPARLPIPKLRRTRRGC